jgi:hypothetical protein
VHGKDIRGQTGTKASSVVKDTTPPVLLRITLLRDTGTVYLFFDDAVSIDSFNTTAVTLQVAAPGAAAVQLNCTTAQRNRGSLREVALGLAAPCLYANGTASGGDSDWTVLQKAGLRVTATLAIQPLLLDAADGLVQDYAVPARDSPAVAALTEAGPNCQVSATLFMYNNNKTVAPSSILSFISELHREPQLHQIDDCCSTAQLRHCKSALNLTASMQLSCFVVVCTGTLRAHCV